MTGAEPSGYGRRSLRRGAVADIHATGARRLRWRALPIAAGFALAVAFSAQVAQPLVAGAATAAPVPAADLFSTNLSGVAFTDAGHGWIAGASSGVARIDSTSDAGADWYADSVPAGATALGRLSVFGTGGWAAATVNGAAALLHTGDGTNWTSVALPAALGTDVPVASFSDAQHGWVIDGSGGGSVVASTADAGATWTQTAWPFSWSPGTIDFVDATHGWAGAAQQGDGVHTFAATTDGGRTWVQETNTAGITSVESLAFVSDTVGYAGGRDGGDHGHLLKTSDGGVTWSPASSGLSLGVQGVGTMLFSDADHGWVALQPQHGVQADIYATADGGTTWAYEPAPQTTFSIAQFALTSSTVWGAGTRLCGGGGTLVATPTQSPAWTEQIPEQPQPPAYLSGVSFGDATHAWAVGADQCQFGVLVSTTDAGATWTQDALPAGTEGLASVRVTDAEHGWVTAVSYNDAQSFVLSTSDGGQTWTQRLVAPATFSEVDASAAVVAVEGQNSSGSAVWTSTDGGLTWTVTQGAASLGGVSWVGALAVDGSTLYVGGTGTGAGGPAIASAGLTPGAAVRFLPNVVANPSDMGPVISLAVHHDSSSDSVWAATYGYLYTQSSIAAGAWSSVASLPPGMTAYSLALPSSTTGFAVGYFTQVWSTTDGGQTWTSSAPVTGSPWFHAVAAASPTTACAVGTGDTANPGGIACTADGTTWSPRTLPSPLATAPAAQADDWTIAPTSAASSLSHALAGVTCVGDHECWAVGRYWTPQTPNSADNSIWQGTASGWSGVASPTGNGSNNEGLTDVACGTASFCVAVGTVESSPPQLETAEYLNNSWSFWNPVPKPGLGGSFAGIACPSSATCWAVGSWDNNGTTDPLIEELGSSGWTMPPAPSPAGSATAQLDDVSCVSSTDCVAVGTYATSTGAGAAQLPFADQLAGSTWTLMSPQPLMPGQQATLSSISCAADGSCLAAGTQGTGSTLVEQFMSGAWHLVTDATSGDAGAVLNDVSCVDSSHCWVVGSEGAQTTLVEELSPGGWGVDTTPNLGSNDELVGIACPDISYCATAGSYFDGSQTQTLVEEASPPPAVVPEGGLLPFAGLAAVATAGWRWYRRRRRVG